ncbi:MAG: hypothetical protein V7L25_34555 [Nostoc sp.]|uniref:hypothetical protein n=1 Tax=Nostoc sp. TaxID=1180 RepID=UPI002FF173D8
MLTQLWAVLLQIETSVNCLWKFPQQTKARVFLALHLDGGVNRFHQCHLKSESDLSEKLKHFSLFRTGFSQRIYGQKAFCTL